MLESSRKRRGGGRWEEQGVAKVDCVCMCAGAYGILSCEHRGGSGRHCSNHSTPLSHSPQQPCQVDTAFDPFQRGRRFSCLLRPCKQAGVLTQS